ncbi:MAG: YbjQ family protein [Pseudomonadota bacterium]
MVVNTEQVPGREIETVLCLVQGSTVRAKNIGKDWLAGFKNLVGGEVSEYTELLQEARKIATDRMVQQAMSIGANGVINTRYTTSSVAQGMSEILAYGTAVKFKPAE